VAVTAVVVVQTYQRKQTSSAEDEFTELREEYKQTRRSGCNYRANLCWSFGICSSRWHDGVGEQRPAEALREESPQVSGHGEGHGGVERKKTFLNLARKERGSKAREGSRQGKHRQGQTGCCVREKRKERREKKEEKRKKRREEKSEVGDGS